VSVAREIYQIGRLRVQEQERLGSSFFGVECVAPEVLTLSGLSAAEALIRCSSDRTGEWIGAVQECPRWEVDISVR
jgi:hypothetical protein